MGSVRLVCSWKREKIVLGLLSNIKLKSALFKVGGEMWVMDNPIESLTELLLKGDFFKEVKP